MSVSLSEILAGASAHAVPLPGECAGYLVLLAADQAQAAPRRIAPSAVSLFDDGSVRVDGAPAATELESERDLRALLDALLLAASSATPALLRASRRAPEKGIAALVREIETALIPVNRAAAQRALARLLRETERAKKAGQLRLGASPPPLPVSAMPAVGAPSAPEPSAPEPTLPPPSVHAASAPASVSPPPVRAIEGLEIETRPESVVARRSARPPALPPAVLPAVVETQPTTPVLGTVLESFAEDELEIPVVLDEELIEEEYTVMLPTPAPSDLTEPCPPALECEADDDEEDERVPLALAAPAPPPLEVAPPPRIPLPKPRPSDVDELLERLADTALSGSADVRSSLKGLAGLEPTPGPPGTQHS